METRRPSTATPPSTDCHPQIANQRKPKVVSTGAQTNLILPEEDGAMDHGNMDAAPHDDETDS